ncbi:DUF29 domain-containing protein [uncultured Sphingomonas sp.]|uniref:DUF29 domain-containing protein n=1 Tax=uncultured Sphingomonas sp. TaxID=158754 RepID=UPI0035C9BC87
MADRDPHIGTRRNYAGYDEDFAAWVDAQALLLREGRFGELDLDNLIDEVEGVGKSEFRSFYHAIELILLHMVKWDYQIERQGRSWRTTINTQRDEVLQLLKENPSYKSRIDEAIVCAYGPVPSMVETATTIPVERLPKVCPYTWDEIMSRQHNLNPDRQRPN